LCADLKINPNIFNGPNRNSGNYVQHLKEDINYYLKNIIKKCSKEQIVGVICTETIKDDMKNIFNIDVNKHSKNSEKNYNYDKNITDENYQILKDYLKKDYMIIDQMYEKGWINDKQYEILKI